MVKNMRQNVPNSTAVYVYDISQEAIDDLEGIEGIQSCNSATEVCEKSVSHS